MPKQTVFLGTIDNDHTGDSLKIGGDKINDNFDELYPAVALNTAKITNANHSGDATGDTALTLATVNANVGAFTNATVTVNAKGLITACANGASSPMLLTANFRIIERGLALCVDQVLNATGFAGVESLDGGVTGDWINLLSWAKP